MAERKTSLLLLRLYLLISIGSSWCSIRHDLKRDDLQANELAIKGIEHVKTRRLAKSGVIQVDAPARLGRTLKEDLGLGLPDLDPTQRPGVPGSAFSRTVQFEPGQAKNWTVSLLESDPMTDTFVNATVLGKSTNSSLSIYCSPGFGKTYNDSGTLPTARTAVWKSGVMKGSAVLLVKTNTTDTSIFNETTTKTGLNDGKRYTHGVTCMVEYSRENALPANVTVTVTHTFPTPTLVAEEQDALRTIYQSCCQHFGCYNWRSYSSKSLKSEKLTDTFTDFCKAPGNICHDNGTLSQLDFTGLDLDCFPNPFPYSELAAFKSLNTITINITAASVNATAFTDFTASLAGSRNLKTISIVGPLFKGPMLPETLVTPDQTTICDLVSRSVDDLELIDVKKLSGTIPECLFNSASRLRSLTISNTNVSSMPDTPKPSGQLRSLWLTSNANLTGSMPSLVGKQPELKYLVLYNNSFSGQVPESLSNLKKLDSLEISVNYFTGNMSAWLPASPGLTSLAMGYNKFNGSLPEALGSFQNLRLISVPVNKFTGAIPDSIGLLPNLLNLNVQYNNFTALPAFSGNCSVKTITAASTRISALPASLFALPSLEYLDVSKSNISGPLSEVAPGALSNLTTLSLYLNKISSSIPASFTSLKKLKYLNLDDNELTGAIPESLLNISTLRVASFQNNNLTSMPSLLGAPSQLQWFGISNNSIEAPLDDTLCNFFPKLQALVVSENYFYGAFPECLGNIGTLEKLYLHGNNITGPLPPSFGENLPSMMEFVASSNPIGGTLPDGLTKASGLRHLQLQNASLVGTLPTSYGKLSGLTIFDFSNNSLSGTIPQSFKSMLSFMLNFDGSFNELVGAVPNFTTGAFYLSLQSNKLDTLPEGWHTNTTFTGYTSKMDLSDNSLSGPFPYNLGRSLKYLQYLDISYNNFSGPLPTPPSAQDNFFANLLVLNASHNHFSGSIPEAYGQIGIFNPNTSAPVTLPDPSNSSSFDISYNDFTGNLPMFLKSDSVPSNVQQNIHLGGNKFNPQSCSNMTAYLKDTCITATSAYSARKLLLDN